ncbi:MAG: class I SAM-dependent methyltransferase [Candidatus Omnitrophica bacterium]|nr:class I SAM-dependent methyltransferase [Candidatus Omnitrophota bacterium]
MLVFEVIFDKIRLIFRILQGGAASSGLIPEIIRKKALRILKHSKGRLLDVGCGEGLFLKNCVLKKGLQCLGVDLVFSSLQEARNRHPLINNLILADTRFLPLKDDSLDCVVMLNLSINIAHYVDLLVIFREIKRVLRRDGMVVFDFRERNNFINYLRFKFLRLYDRKVPIVNTYSIGDFKDFFEDEQLEVEQLYSIFLGTAKLAVLGRKIENE